MRPGTSRGADDANGTVVADAVYIVKVEGFTDAVTWAPALSASGSYQVYAKWTSDETRATDALYRITHSGGTAEVSVNQRVGGGLWHYLGSYAFDPLSSPTVMLVANDNGSVAADAVRFVGGPAGAADIAYLHIDHLGTPQAMTDANGQLLWWRDQTPFGQTVAEGGFSASPLRFPGQYADAESGLSYNYFRDYDPALGRYIQSDPIGLRGVLNTYGYVRGNPVSLVDPFGLFPVCKKTEYGRWLDLSSEVILEILFRTRVAYPRPTGPTVSPNLDPRRPKKGPVGPSVGMEYLVMEHRLEKRSFYEVSQEFRRYWVECQETIVRECGEEEVFEDSFEFVEKGDPVRRLLGIELDWVHEELAVVGPANY